MNIPMSNITLSVTVDEFVVAETVKLIFSAQLALSGEFATVDPKNTVLESAKSIYDGDWYVTSSNRHEGPGGIEVVNYTLNVRVKDSAISAAKQKLEEANVRKGLRFELSELDYTPTQAQLEEANKELRKKIYSRANDELAILNDTIKSGEGDWLVGSIQFGGAPQVAKSMRSQMYNSVSASSAGAFNDDDGDDEGGITQKVSLSANLSFTKKIYARV
jgi:hypothetical protein